MRATSSPRNAGRRTTSASRASDGARLADSAVIDTALLSTPGPAPMTAPSRSCASAIWVASRVWVPSSSRASISDWVPGRSRASAAVPASKFRLIATLGTLVRRTSVTGTPLASRDRSIAGKARSPTAATGGATRLGPITSLGAGFFASGAGAGIAASSPHPPISSPFSVRGPGTVLIATTGRPSQRFSAALTSAGVTAAMRLSCFL